MAFGYFFNYEEELFYRDQWIVVCDNFKPDYVFDRNPPSDMNEDFYYSWTPVVSIEDALTKANEFSLTPVLIQPLNAQVIKGTISLVDYVHPLNALYIFGDDNGGYLESDYGIQDKVYVPSLNQSVTYWSFQTGCMVTYDRMSKQ